MRLFMWIVLLGSGPGLSWAYLFDRSASPRWDVDMAEGPIAFVDLNLCVPKAVRIRSVEIFAPVLGFIEGLYIQIWHLGHDQVHILKAQSPISGWTSRGSIFAAPLDLPIGGGECVGWAYNRSSGGVIGFSHADNEDQVIVNAVYFARLLTWPPVPDSRIKFHNHERRNYAIRFDWEPLDCWEKGQSWRSCCGPSRSGTRIVPACWPADIDMHRACCGEAIPASAHLGNPHCFTGEDEQVYSYELCCDRQYGPEGNTSCWDGLMDFQYCCRPAVPAPQRDAACWQGKLQHRHELCCHGTKHAEGPRGLPSCWMQLDKELSYGRLEALRCCDVSQLGGAGGYRCLREGHVTTCSLPGIAFRQLTQEDLLFARSDAEYPLAEDPLFWAVPKPRRAAEAHLLLLGVGPFAASAVELEQEAKTLGIFKQIYAYTNFSFTDSAGIWRRHIQAWQNGARIAGFGWWKPVLCRRHLAAMPRHGILVFSDAGNRLRQESAGTWQALLSTVQNFDVLAVLETEFVERRFTKRLTIERFAAALRGTAAVDEGQFVSRLLVFRKTPAAEKLLQAWEQLVRNINLVDETLHPNGEDGFFQAHRHEQSILSLLLKCAISGRAIKIGRMTNLSARVLTLRSDVEASQLMDFARRQSKVA